MPRSALADATALPSGMVTFLFTDVVGSTRLFQEHGDTFVAALQRTQYAVRGAIEAAGGVVVGTEGDSTFAAFWSAASAITAAVTAQDAAARLQATPELTIRAGLHTGYARPLEGDYLAMPVHVAARVASAAGPGQVLVSGDTIARAGAIAENVVELGAFELRDVAEPVRLWRAAGPDEPPRASPVRRTNVQPAHTSLVGRDAELAELTRLLGTQRLVTLVGTGGIGKTRLASQVATTLAPSFPGGAWLVELASVDHDDGVAAAVHLTIGAPPTDAAEDPLVVELARRGDTLLVLDNCEHVVQGAAELADRLLRTSPTTRILATSRESLDVADERVVRLRPLDPAPDGPAATLFRNRAERAGCAVPAADASLVTEVCRVLDGLPLAIELAASRLGTMPLGELRNALLGNPDAVPLTSRRGEHRQRGLDELVDWSVRLLSPAERTDLMCLTVFAARFTGADADTLLSAARGSGRPSLAELAHRGLVDVDGDRYRMLFSVRTPMARQLAAEPELAAAAETALVTWANERAESARSAGWRGAVDTVAPEQANLEAAVRAALRRGLAAPRVVQLLGRLWDDTGTGIPPDIAELVDRLAQAPVPQERAGLLMLLSCLSVTRGLGLHAGLADRLGLANEIIARARELGDAETVVEALSELAPVFVVGGDVDGARTLYAEIIAAAGAAGQWHRPARDLVNLAISFHIGPEPLEALPWYDRAVDVALQTGDEDNRAVALANSGDVLISAGRLREASARLRQALKLLNPTSRISTGARAMLADALVRLDEPNAMDFARDAERDLAEMTRVDASMADYLERLRITIRAAEQRAAARGAGG